MKRQPFDFVLDELAWLDELIPISFNRGAACDTQKLQKLHIGPISVSPLHCVHVQWLGAWESISCIPALAPAVFQASKHVQATLAESLRASLRVLPAETMVDGFPRAPSLFSMSFVEVKVGDGTPKRTIIHEHSIFRRRTRRIGVAG